MDEYIGQIVVSKAGRDTGRAFVIVGVADDAHVLIADGQLRGLSRPKKKKLKHIRPTGVYVEGLPNSLNSGGLLDADVAKAIGNSGFGKTHAQGEFDVETRCN